MIVFAVVSSRYWTLTSFHEHAPARAVLVPSEDFAAWMVVVSEHAHHDDRGPDEEPPSIGTQASK